MAIEGKKKRRQALLSVLVKGQGSIPPSLLMLAVGLIRHWGDVYSSRRALAIANVRREGTGGRQPVVNELDRSVAHVSRRRPVSVARVIQHWCFVCVRGGWGVGVGGAVYVLVVGHTGRVFGGPGALLRLRIYANWLQKGSPGTWRLLSFYAPQPWHVTLLAT